MAQPLNGRKQPLVEKARAWLAAKFLGVTLPLGFVLLPLALPLSGLCAEQNLGTPTCNVRLDLQYELQKTARVTVGQVEVAPPVVQLMMSKAGDTHWDELTKHGKKYPGICRDDEHPYYVLVWKVGDGYAEGGLYVLDNGCLVYPAVSSTVSVSDNREKAIKKVFEDALSFLVANGRQPAPSAPSSLTCWPPETLGPTKYKLKAQKEPPENAATSPETPSPPASDEGTIIVGTGFFVSEHGHILTNAHVVSSCKQIQTRDGRAVSLIDKDEQIDLALIKVEVEAPAVARFRIRPLPRLGDSVIAFGFPLQGLLSSEGNMSMGTVAATSGLADDPRFLQISAPVQPGNNGSPLLDSGGDVIGIVESKLDAAEAFRVVGDLPENVNFAIRGSEAIRFLEKNHVPYHAVTTEAIPDLKVADVAARAKQFSLPIECLK